MPAKTGRATVGFVRYPAPTMLATGDDVVILTGGIV
jgi:hypothetical protein